jgi:hypothetical protein
MSSLVQGQHLSLQWFDREPEDTSSIVTRGTHYAQLGLKTIGNGRENAQTITVTVFFAEIGNGNGNVGRTNETDITRYRERNIFNRERVDYDRESVTRKIADQVPNRPTYHDYYL